MTYQEYLFAHRLKRNRQIQEKTIGMRYLYRADYPLLFKCVKNKKIDYVISKSNENS